MLYLHVLGWEGLEQGREEEGVEGKRWVKACRVGWFVLTSEHNKMQCALHPYSTD
ncbi:hypothetical protein ElyMa_003267700, partial [Elysia marginata]